MSHATVKSLVELLAERPEVDNTGVFAQLWDITRELSVKLQQRFTLTPDASSAPFASYTSLNGDAKGSLNTFTGPEIDWLVHSHIGNPKHSFSNMHFTVWLGPHINVPHFGMALGTMPDIFYYFDYVPRTDLMLDLAYLDRYYEPANARAIALQKDPQNSTFYSKTLYMRASVSETGYVYLTKPTPERIALIREVAHEMLDRWLGYVAAAEPVPPSDRVALAARDLHIRRTIAERDPANVVGEQLFGKDTADQLVRGLWGGDRVNPRPQ